LNRRGKRSWPIRSSTIGGILGVLASSKAETSCDESKDPDSWKSRLIAVYKAERFSDHAPLSIDYDWNL
jgi:hypothetical protein